MSASAEYRIWAGMRKRCLNPNYREFHLYGGRGINICDRWAEFNAFYSDMGPRPSSKHSIDRIDVNGDYSPENCRWATDLQQSENTRRNHLFTYHGEVITLRQIAIRADVPYQRLYHQVIRRAKPIEEAITLVSG